MLRPLNKLSFLSSFIVLCVAVSAVAKSWRSIIPLHSKRADVRRLLGKPIIGGDGSIELYELKEGRAHVMYARQPCEQGLPADWGNWNVARDTVVNISITLNKELPVADLKIRNIERHKWYTDDAGATYYHDRQRGIEYQVQNGVVTAITYGPAGKDKSLRCKKNVRLIRY
jgi:hypothetical protein